MNKLAQKEITGKIRASLLDVMYETTKCHAETKGLMWMQGSDEYVSDRFDDWYDDEGGEQALKHMIDLIVG